MAVIQPRPTHILYQCAKFGDDRTSFNVIWRVRRLTCNNSIAYIKNWTDNFFQIFFNTWRYQIYNIPIGFSDLENVGLDTKFVFLGWPKVKIWAIQFSEDFDGGHFEKCPKRWGRPNLYGVNISIIDQWGPLNKMIPLMEDPGGGGGCTVTPLGPWTIILYII